MSRLPFLFIITGMVGFVFFHTASLFTLFDWLEGGLRGPTGWFYVHLFVLGWATMLAKGAVYQLIHVILQSKIYSERLGYIHYFAFTIGIIGLLYGFMNGKPEYIAGFASLAFTAILLFAWNMGITLMRAGKWDAITISAACAVLYLVLTGISGMTMGLNFAFGIWSELHERLFGAHIWFGTVGWFGLLITGFSYKMLPMFYLAHDYPDRLQKINLVLWNAAVIGGASSFLFDRSAWALWCALFVLAAAVAIYNVHLLQIRKKRHKRNPGQGIKWSMYGNQAFAVIILVCVIFTFLFPERMLNAKPVLLAGWIYLGGWVSFMILCYASKIIPFLWWTNKYGKHVGKPGTPKMTDLLDENKVNLGLAVTALSLLALFVGLAFNLQWVIWIAGIVCSVISLIYITLLGLVFSK